LMFRPPSHALRVSQRGLSGHPPRASLCARQPRNPRLVIEKCSCLHRRGAPAGARDAGRVHPAPTAFSHRDEHHDFLVLSQQPYSTGSVENIRWTRGFFEAMGLFFEGGGLRQQPGRRGRRAGQGGVRRALRAPGRLERSLRPDQPLPPQPERQTHSSVWRRSQESGRTSIVKTDTYEKRGLSSHWPRPLLFGRICTYQLRHTHLGRDPLAGMIRRERGPEAAGPSSAFSRTIRWTRRAANRPSGVPSRPVLVPRWPEIEAPRARAESRWLGGVPKFGK
jgi:hypothetical protein